jgi:outer membrane protein assembly factor BamB
MQVSPTIGNGLVYVADLTLVLHAYDATSGVEAWSLPMHGGTEQPTTVALDGSLLLVGITGHLIMAVDALSGAIRWSRHAHIDSDIAVGSGRIYYESRGPSYPAPLRMTALTETTGHVVWSSDLGANGPVGLNLGPSLANGVVYGTSAAGAVVAFDATTGARLWIDRTVGVAATNPAVVNGMVYVASYEGVFAFGLAG